MRSPSGAVHAHSAAGCPLSKPGHYATGELRRWTKKHGQARSAAQEPREGLAAGTMLMFDGTSPHQAPGVMRSEGERRTLYLGYQGDAAYAKKGAPILAAEPAGAPEADPGAWHPAFSLGGDFLIGHGGKRAVDEKGAKRARPEEGEPEEAELGEAGEITRVHDQNPCVVTAILTA
eukprot:4532051-Prymnesium_polylepis.1